MTTTFVASFTIAFSLKLPFIASGLTTASSYISTGCLNQFMTSTLIAPFTTIAPPLLQTLLSRVGLWSPAVNTLVQTVIGSIQWCQTLTTLFHISMDILFVERSACRLYVRIRALTLRDVVNHMICDVLVHEDVSESSDSNRAIRPTRFYEGVGYETSGSGTSSTLIEDLDDGCATPIKGSPFSPHPSYPLPATVGRKFRRSLRRIWSLRRKTTADVVANSLSVTATISNVFSVTSSMESATSTSTQVDSTSVSDEWEDDRSRALASDHLEGICVTRCCKMRPDETLRMDQWTNQSACPSKRRQGDG
ncbi:hypothetical protein V8B97DRAFT_1967459 [Scleroderma yunnanense]